MRYTALALPTISCQYAAHIACRSALNAMWMTLLNLTGEAPLADYTVAGKIITALMGILAVGVFAVPTGLIAAGFSDWVEGQQEAIEEAKEKEEEKEEVEKVGLEVGAPPVMPDPRTDGSDEGRWRHKVYVFVEGLTPVGRKFNAAIIILILVTIFQVQGCVLWTNKSCIEPQS